MKLALIALGLLAMLSLRFSESGPKADIAALGDPPLGRPCHA
jgi:hypothetical protein